MLPESQNQAYYLIICISDHSDRPWPWEALCSFCSLRIIFLLLHSLTIAVIIFFQARFLPPSSSFSNVFSLSHTNPVDDRLWNEWDIVPLTIWSGSPSTHCQLKQKPGVWCWRALASMFGIDLAHRGQGWSLHWSWPAGEPYRGKEYHTSKDTNPEKTGP